MTQQVNLYQPIFRKQEKVFSTKTMLQSLGVVTAALALMYSYGLWQARGFQDQLRQFEQRRAEAVARLEQLRTMYPERARSISLEQEVAQLRLDIGERERVVARLRDRAMGNRQGFAEYLAGLSRQKPDSLWLTQVSIDQGGGQLALLGSTLKPELVPRYLQRLSGEPAFQGVEFRQFAIQRPEDKPGQVDFALHTAPAEKEAAR